MTVALYASLVGINTRSAFQKTIVLERLKCFSTILHVHFGFESYTYSDEVCA